MGILIRYKKWIIIGLVVLTFGWNGNIPVRAAEVIVPPDIENHENKLTIMRWLVTDKIKGYDDGTFRPNNPITRAEFVTLINRAFGLKGEAAASFQDVKAGDWYYSEIKTAIHHEYISGFEDLTFRPQLPVTREMVAVIIARLLKLSPDRDYFVTDAHELPEWSKGWIGAVLKNSMMTTGANGEFEPGKFVTRSEVVMDLDRALQWKLSTSQELIPDRITVSGEYGPIGVIQTVRKGDIVIAAGDVELRNMVIEGNLYLDARIGNGQVNLSDIDVKGEVRIEGGGSAGVHIHNSRMGKISIHKKDGDIRVVASGTSRAGYVDLESSAILKVQPGTSGFGRVTIRKGIPENAVVELEGHFASVEAGSVKTQIVIKGTVDQLIVLSLATQNSILLSDGYINTLESLAPISVTGTGKVQKANLAASGSSFSEKPEILDLGFHVTAFINGELVDAYTYRDMYKMIDLGNRIKPDLNFNFTGSVRGEDGRIIAHPLVFVRNALTNNLEYHVVADDNGVFSFSLPDGSYEIYHIDIEDGSGRILQSYFPYTSFSVIDGVASPNSISLTVKNSNVSGTIVNPHDADGSVNGNIVFSTITNSSYVYTTTVRNGRFELYLPDGDYKVAHMWDADSLQLLFFNNIVHVEGGTLPYSLELQPIEGN